MGVENDEDLDLHVDENGEVTGKGLEALTAGDNNPRVDHDDGQLDDDDEERLGSGGTNDTDVDPEREALRARRRDERHAKKQKAREREQTYVRQIESLSTTVNELATELQRIQNGNLNNQMQQLDNTLSEASQNVQYWDKQVKDAVALNDLGLVTEAQENLFKARQQLQYFAGLKQHATQRMQQPKPADPRMLREAQAWMSRHKGWYNKPGAERDTRMAKFIDQELSDSGLFDPRTEAYWEELDARLSEALPHRFRGGSANRSNSQYNREQGESGQDASSPVSGADRDSPRGSDRPGSFTLSQDQIKAMKDAGMWEDPKKRAKMTQRYIEEARRKARQGKE